MSDKLKSVDCQELVRSLVKTERILNDLGVNIPQSFVVQGFLEALKSVPSISASDRSAIATQAGSITAGLIIARREMEQDGVL